jgi:hypothetical protein
MPQIETTKQFYCVNCKAYGHEAGARERCPSFLKGYNLACEKQQVTTNEHVKTTIIKYQIVETNVTLNTLLLLKMMLGDPNFNKLDFTQGNLTTFTSDRFGNQN